MALNHKVVIDTRSRIQNSVNFMLNCGKNGMSGCWRIGRAKI